MVVAPLLLVACGGAKTSVDPPATAATFGTSAPTDGTSSQATSPTGQAARRPTDAAGVIAGLGDSGLPIGEVKVYTAADDLNQLLGRPGQYTSKASFHDTRLPADPAFGIDAGGSVEFFASEADARRRSDYVKTVTQSLSFAVEYSYLRGNALIRISRALTPDQAADYDAAGAELMRQ